MSNNISKRRSTSVVPQVGAFNNWFNVHEKKVSLGKAKPTRFISTSFYRATLPVNPQSSFFQHQQQPRHNRTFSSFRNTQSRLSVTRQDVMQMSRQINYMTERIKKSRLDMRIMHKQINIDLQQKQQLLKQKILGLKKFMKSVLKDNQTRGSKLKSHLCNLKDNYRLMKQKVDYIDERLSAVESQCGFMDFKSKLMI